MNPDKAQREQDLGDDHMGWYEDFTRSQTLLEDERLESARLEVERDEARAALAAERDGALDELAAALAVLTPDERAEIDAWIAHARARAERQANVERANREAHTDRVTEMCRYCRTTPCCCAGRTYRSDRST